MASPRQTVGLRILFGQDYKNWSWCQDQLSYTTPVYIAEKITELITRYYTKNLNVESLTVWDMFAGLGVDSIYLAKCGNSVFCNEISDPIFNILTKNITSLNMTELVKTSKLDCVCCLDAITNCGVNLIYFDPPWGDSFNSTKIFDFSNVKLSNGIYIMELLHLIYTKVCKNIVIKSPLRCNTFEKLDFLNIKHIFVFRKQRIKFIFT